MAMETNIEYLNSLVAVLESSNLILQEQIKRLKKDHFNENQARLDLQDKMAILKNRFITKGTEKLNPTRPVKDSSSGLLHNKSINEEQEEEINSNLEVEEVFYSIGDDKSCSCPTCTSPLSEIKGQFEESTEIDVIERTYVQKRHKRKKYRCKECDIIVTAKGAKKLVPGSKYSTNFAINVAVDKFSYHLPLERQRRLMEEQGLKVGVKTLYGLTEKLYEKLSPILPMIKKEILSHGYVHIDETRGKLLRTKTNGFIWAISNQKGAYFQYETTRSGKVAEEILKGYSGHIISDGFSGYKKYQQVDSKIKSANCWSHARRKFFDCLDQYPKARDFLDLVSRLYRIEYEAEDFNHLKILRENKSRDVVLSIEAWLRSEVKISTRRSKFDKAIRYALSLWDGLTIFLNDPKIPLDNNQIERALRNPVKGRDNYLGFQTINGADVAMFFYTVIESCKMLKINPRKYLRDQLDNLNIGKKIIIPSFY